MVSDETKNGIVDAALLMPNLPQDGEVVPPKKLEKPPLVHNRMVSWGTNVVDNSRTDVRPRVTAPAEFQGDVDSNKVSLNVQIDSDSQWAPTMPNLHPEGTVYPPKKIEKPAVIHSRNVSWGKDVANNGRAELPTGKTNPCEVTEDSLNVPSLMARTATRPNSRPPLGRGYSAYSKKSAGSVSRRVLGEPLEEEAAKVLRELDTAEMSLLKSLDERDPLRPRVDTGSSILSGVPREFSVDDTESMNPNSPSKIRDIPKPEIVKRQTTGKGANHRRQLTVEEALFGLTTALSAIKTEEQMRGDRQESSNDNLHRSDNGSTTDRLAATANMLFRRSHTPSELPTKEELAMSHDTPNPVTGGNGEPKPKLVSAKSRWRILRESIYEQKKTDDLGDHPESVDEVEQDIEEGGTSGGSSVDLNGTSPGHTNDPVKDSSPARRRTTMNPFRHLPYSDRIKNEWELFGDFLRPRKTTILTYARYIFFYLWLPALGVAALLYHVFNNPPAKTDKASASWWIIFICMREVSLLLVAKCIQAVVVDFFALQTRAILRAFGPLVTLLIVQSKGWPFLAFFWGILNFALVTGDSAFNQHWLYWQDLWGLFNEANPSGSVTSSIWFNRVCAIAVGVGAAVAAKRVAVGIILGRQTFANFSEPLAKVMNKMLHITQVACLARDIEKRELYRRKYEGILGKEPRFSNENLLTLIHTSNIDGSGRDDDSVMDMTRSMYTGEEMEKVVDPEDTDPYTGGLSFSQRARVSELLGSWEEPRRGPSRLESVSVSSVLHFRRALAHMDTSYPFSAAFGIADTRESCVISAQEVYDRLVMEGNLSNGVLHFDTIAALAVGRNGELDNEKAKDLIRTFRPDREGLLSMVDFVRSIDSVYRELRMLRATVASALKIDRAIESIVNVGFYVVLACIILWQINYDPLAMFLSLSSVILAFAFMIGSASAKYFEGLLFIVVQRPYGIGDRINIANTEAESNMAGAQGWIVDDVNLFTTTLYMAGTNERATIANSALAKSRIINGARSPKATVVMNIKFHLETPYAKIQTFKAAVEKFVKARPREWLSLAAIRVGRVEVDLGYSEYTIVLVHRERWQNIGMILDSKQNLYIFCLELSKKLDMRYKSPPLPIDLNFGKGTPQIEFKYDGAKELDNAGLSLSPKSLDDDFSMEMRNITAMFENN